MSHLTSIEVSRLAIACVFHRAAPPARAMEYAAVLVRWMRMPRAIAMMAGTPALQYDALDALEDIEDMRAGLDLHRLDLAGSRESALEVSEAARADCARVEALNMRRLIFARGRRALFKAGVPAHQLRAMCGAQARACEV